MKKVTVSLYDENFGAILCTSNIGATKIIEFTFDDCYETINDIIKMFHLFKFSNRTTMSIIYITLRTLGYIVEECNAMKLNPDFRSKIIGIDKIQQRLSNNIYETKIALYVNLGKTDIDPGAKRYIMNNIAGIAQRGSGKSYLTSLMLNSIDGGDAYKEFGRIHSKLKGGEINMTKLLPNPKRVICSGPVTTVIYDDGTKTHVRKMEEDQNDYEKAFLLSWLYKTYGKTVVNEKLDEFKEEFNKDVDNAGSKEDSLFTFSAEKISERLSSALTKGI